MEAFSDGVFSIAATLLVLDLALHPPGTPLEQVLHAWPAYLGYLVSFLTIGAAWLRPQRDDRPTDPRRLVADAHQLAAAARHCVLAVSRPGSSRKPSHDTDGERVFVTMYGLTLLTIRLLRFALDAYARREHLYAHDQADEELQTDRHSSAPS